MAFRSPASENFFKNSWVLVLILLWVSRRGKICRWWCVLANYKCSTHNPFLIIEVFWVKGRFKKKKLPVGSEITVFISLSIWGLLLKWLFHIYKTAGNFSVGGFVHSMCWFGDISPPSKSWERLWLWLVGWFSSSYSDKQKNQNQVYDSWKGNDIWNNFILHSKSVKHIVCKTNIVLLMMGHVWQ